MDSDILYNHPCVSEVLCFLAKINGKWYLASYTYLSIIMYTVLTYAAACQLCFFPCPKISIRMVRCLAWLQSPGQAGSTATHSHKHKCWLVGGLCILYWLLLLVESIMRSLPKIAQQSQWSRSEITTFSKRFSSVCWTRQGKIFYIKYGVWRSFNWSDPTSRSHIYAQWFFRVLFLLQLPALQYDIIFTW